MVYKIRILSGLAFMFFLVSCTTIDESPLKVPTPDIEDPVKVEESIINTEKPEINEEVEEIVVKSNVNHKREESVENVMPISLLMPFQIKDINPLMGEVNPLGVVRFDKDQSDIGHPGIDIPLKESSPIYAVADGPVVLIDSAGDPWEGMKVFQLLQKTGEGTGWAFVYEHIKLAENVVVGTELKGGDLVGTKAAPDSFTIHLQLSKVFNNFKYTSDATCWPDYLSIDGKNALDTWWDSYSKTDHLLNSWKTTKEDGKFPFKGLMNDPRLCYDLGTDVR